MNLLERINYILPHIYFFALCFLPSNSTDSFLYKNDFLTDTSSQSFPIILIGLSLVFINADHSLLELLCIYHEFSFFLLFPYLLGSYFSYISLNIVFLQGFIKLCLSLALFWEILHISTLSDTWSWWWANACLHLSSLFLPQVRLLFQAHVVS